MLLCEEFNNVHLDTSFASIDQKQWNCFLLKGLTPESENCSKSHWSQTCLPCIVMMVDICYVHVSFVIYNNKGSECKKSISIVTIKLKSKKSVGYVI